MFLIGLLLGYDHTIENLEASSKTKSKKQNDKQLNFSDDSFFNGDDFNTPFEEAIEFLKSKIPMTKTEWNELEKKLRFRAFTVGALSEADAIEKVKQALIDNLEKREPFYKAWEKFKDIAKSDGKDYFARYFETVYRTNIQSAYNAGRLMQYKNNTPPAWELLFMEDSRMSDICTNLMNEVGRQAIKSDDAFWSTVGFPPYHFNCRTTFRAVYPDELQTGEIKITEPQNPTPLTNGFGGNPLDKESFWKLTDTMLERAEKYGLTDAIERVAKNAGLENFTITKKTKTTAAKLATKTAPKTEKTEKEVLTKETEKVLDETKKIEDNKASVPATLSNFEKHSQNWENTVVKKELSDNEIKILGDKVKKLIDDNEYSMRVWNDVLEKILQDGRFKNQFETNTSGGLLDKEMRIKATKQLFGESAIKDAKDFEKYGYLGTKGFINDASAADQYGDCIVHFKKDMLKNRVTYTIDDSLDFAYDEKIIAGNADNPRANGIYIDGLREAFELLSSNNLTLPNFLEECTSSYFELQYHGELTTDCISEVCFTEGLPSKEVVDILKSKNIKVFIMEGVKANAKKIIRI